LFVVRSLDDFVYTDGDRPYPVEEAADCLIQKWPATLLLLPRLKTNRRLRKGGVLTRFSCILAFFLCTACTATAESNAQVQYSVDLTTPNRAVVKIEVPSLPSHLFMQIGGSGSDEGFAPYVHDLIARSGANQVQVERNGAEWKIKGAQPGSGTITYWVDLSFASSPWPAGNEQAGYTDGHAMYLVTKAIFIESDLPGDRIIRFRMDKTHKLAIPWVPSNSGEFVLLPRTMLEDSMVFGSIEPQRYSGGRFQLQVVMLGSLRNQTTEVGQIGGLLARHYSLMFPDNKDTSYLITMFPGKPDAEAFPSSFASSVKAPLRREERIDWANTIAHELFHHWCGHTLRPAKEEETAWFFEGFTEYFANLALVRQGVVPPEEFLQRVGIRLAQYEYFLASPLFSKVTLRDAGTKKGSYRFGVYSGGWAVAFVIDQELRKTNKSIEDLMRKLLSRPDRTHISLDIILRTLTEIGGSGLTEQVETALTTRESLDVDGYLLGLGIGAVGQTYAGEKFIYLLPPDSSRDRRRRVWAGF
jgi:predicted metalloprotease with PDZ domain